MKRRNFFALLLAPLLARFAPKPLTTLNLSFEFYIKPGTVSGFIEMQRQLTMLQLHKVYTHDFRIKIPGPEGTQESDFS